MMRKTITYYFLAIFGIFLTAGCASVPLALVDAAADQVRYSHNIDHAEAGDPSAQYAIGKALCCSEEAILWFCRSASQGMAEAMFRLGRIYAGDTADGPGLISRVIAFVNEGEADHAQATYWFQMAAKAGEATAISASEQIELSPAERVSLADYISGNAVTECESLLKAAG
jgi:TPR repeat protein